MGRSCTVCTHEERQAIDRALVSRSASYRDIAGQYSVSKTAVSRHTREHLPELLAKAHHAQEMADADEMLMDMRRLQARTLLALTRAEQARDWMPMLRAVREARENIRLLGELHGKIATQGTTTIINNPEYIEARTIIVSTLEDFPEAKRAVVSALEGGSNGRG